jgi:hypothetical protein
MTTNVPQDVIENTHKPDLIEKLSGLARSIEVCEGWRPTCIDEAIAKLRDQCAGGEAVGAAVTSPDDPGFTIASFEASDVPAGTMLFTQQHPVRESGEAVAYLDYNGVLKPTRHGVITMKKGDQLYTIPPQANALVAAAYRKAAEMNRFTELERNSLSSIMGWFQGHLGTAWAKQFHYAHLMEGWAKDIESMLAATPADAEAALREMSAHTKEPWTYVTAPGSMIAERTAQIETLGGYEERKVITGWLSFPNASRIVACVNACAGMADPAAELEALRTQLADATRKLEEARKDVVREVIVILDGIDMTETDSEKGWWETSAGAEFGKNKLAKIQAIEQGKGGDDA